MAVKTAEERAAAIRAEADAIEKAAAERTIAKVTPEAPRDSVEARRDAEYKAAIRAAAEAEERASVAGNANQDGPTPEAEMIFLANAEHMKKLEQEQEAKLRAEYRAEQDRINKPKDTFLRSGATTREAFIEQIRAQRAAAKKATDEVFLTEEEKWARLTPAMRARIEGEQARGRERVAAAEAAKGVRTPPEAEPGSTLSTFQANPGMDEVFPVSTKGVTQRAV